MDGLPAQEILSRIGEELLSTTKLPLAVSFLHAEIKGTGLMAPAMARIGHYFTAFQTHVISQAEIAMSRFSMEQALLILEREAKYKSEGPSLAGPLHLPVRVAVAEPAGLHPRPGRHGRRPVLHRGLERLHPHPPDPPGRRRFRRPDLRPLGVLRAGTAEDSTPSSSPSTRRSSARRRARSPGPTAAATRCTSSRPSSASLAIPRSRGPAAPTSSKPACSCSSRRSPSSRTGIKLAESEIGQDVDLSQVIVKPEDTAGVPSGWGKEGSEQEQWQWPVASSEWQCGTCE